MPSSSADGMECRPTPADAATPSSKRARASGQTMNVAVFLPNWIGDAVMATPALRALRRHFDGARLVGVAKPYVAGVLEGGDWFDELLLYRGGPWSQSTPALAWKLRRRRIDLAVLFPNTFRSALAAWLGGCRRR